MFHLPGNPLDPLDRLDVCHRTRPRGGAAAAPRLVHCVTSQSADGSYSWWNGMNSGTLCISNYGKKTCIYSNLARLTYPRASRNRELGLLESQVHARSPEEILWKLAFACKKSGWWPLRKIGFTWISRLKIRANGHLVERTRYEILLWVYGDWHSSSWFKLTNITGDGMWWGYKID